MEKQKISLRVSGKANSGKSTVIMIVKTALKEAGIEVKFDGGFDFDNEKNFDAHTSTNLDKKKAAISTKTVVEIEELQIGR